MKQVENIISNFLNALNHLIYLQSYINDVINVNNLNEFSANKFFNF